MLTHWPLSHVPLKEVIITYAVLIAHALPGLRYRRAATTKESWDASLLPLLVIDRRSGPGL